MSRLSPNVGRRARWTLAVALLALLAPAMLMLPRGSAQQQESQSTNRPRPDVVQMVGPVSQDEDLRNLPYIPPTAEHEEARLMRHPPGEGRGMRRARAAERERELERDNDRDAKPARKSSRKTKAARASASTKRASAAPRSLRRQDMVSSDMPSPTNTFAGMTSNLGCNGCLPPDTDGDVGPNHYIQSVNSSIRIHDKTGNVLAGPITYNSFFSAMGTSTPCGNNQNGGDGIVFYDHMADRWIISDFAFSAFPGAGPFHQCIGVSKTSDPISGGYWLYAVQVDPGNPTWVGDYPKFGLWPDGYYMSVNTFLNNTTFTGVRVYALDRNSMINGGPANTISFPITAANLGDQYSLVPASFRTGSPPPANQPEWFMDINSSAVAGTVETQVFVRRFHVDFATPANSFFGAGATHAPDGIITVNGFVDAFDATSGTAIVPNGTATTTQYLDTLGDKLMYPLVYQNLGGVESIWSSHTVNNNQGGTGPTAIRWYQFNMTGNTIPATPAQQQSFNNGGDGLWRAMPSINVDNQGNASIGYTASSATVNPGIRYAGRLATDPANTMAQGEAVMTPGTGHQTDTSGRWGDYSSMFVDPSDGCTFYHTNEYYSATSAAAWNTSVGYYKFPTCTPSPIATPTPTPTATPTPTPPGPPVSAGPVTVTATLGTPGPTDYATVKAAFDAINAGTHKGSLNVYVLGNTTETAAAVLNASGTVSSSYTSIRMTPSGARTVSGAIAAGSPLIDLNGADFVTIDGLNSGGNSLTFSNTTVSTTASTSTVRFINGAQNNTVTRCNIQGSSTVTVGATAGGTVLFSTSPAVGTTIVGNNNNTVSANNIGPAGANLPVKAITGLGTATNNNTVNTANVIDGNNVFDFFGTGGVSVSGMDIRTGNNNWTIQNNRIYQTATRTFTTTALRYAGITVSGATATNGGTFHTIRNNIIGFGSAAGTGTTTITGSSNEFRGIDLPTVSATTATSVQGNVISGITQTTSRASTSSSSAPFTAISLGTTGGVFDVGNLSGNIIGSLDGSSSIVVNATSTAAGTAPVIGIFDFSFQSDNISNNNVGSITINSGGTGTTTGFRGILISGTAGISNTVNNNTIGGTAAGSITDNIVGSYAVYGIQAAATGLSMNGNTVRNMVGNSNFPATVVMSGLALNEATATDTVNVSRNTVHSLSNASGAAQTSIYAIDLTLPTTVNVTANVIERNLIHSIVNTSTDNSSQMWGIVQRGSATAGVPVRANVQNNMIRLGLDAAGNSITSGLSIIGIRDIQGATGGAGTTVVNYYFNSVYIGGSGVASSSGTFAFNGGALTSTRNYVDNIFWNARSNASGAGKNYAISLAGTAPNPAGLTSNYNVLRATGTGGFTGLFNAVDQTTLANWQTATGQDANSLSVDPLFVNANGSASTGDIHIQAGSPVLAMGTPVVGITNDFDNDPRDNPPDIGADERVAPTSVATTLTVAPATGTYGGTVNLSATLTDGVNPLSGQTINFTLNGNAAGSGVTNGSGVATVSNASLAGINAGSYPTGVGASFMGNGIYLASSGSAALTVNKADTTTTVTVSNATYDGNPHGGTASVTGPAGLNQSLTVTYTGRNSTVYGPSTTPPTNAGDYTASASYAGDSNYNASSDSKDYSIAKAASVITWSNPADIIYGTALSGTQLNATANVPGSFVYTPAAGTVLGYGAHNLHVDFTPTDTANYNNAMKDVSINVLSALFSMTKNVDRQAKVGYNHNYLIAITNNGNAAATSMTLSDPLPSQVRFTAVTTSQGTCSYDMGTHTVNCTLGTLGIGSTINIQITTKALQTGTLNNTATVSASQWDPATGGNTASVSHSSIAEVDLSVSKVDSADPIYISQLTTYTMVVKNYNTPISATGVVLTDSLPASMQFISATTSQGSLVTPPVNSSGIVTANIGTLAVNGTATITVTVRATAAGAITNTASASANENEANPANNSASQTTTVLTATLQKVLLAKQVLTGGCENTTGNVYLTGPAPAGGLTVNLSTTSLAGVTVPASVFIPAGTSVSPNFSVTTSPVMTKQVGTVDATLGMSTVSRNLTINVGSGPCPP
jgi:uncharacterized repeat protein (TIGR01451 family)